MSAFYGKSVRGIKKKESSLYTKLVQKDTYNTNLQLKN